MSLITRCPACTTMFKVVPDQLRVSDGWVRCGQCDEVFDANAHLQSPSEVETESISPEDSSQLDWGGTLEEEVASPVSEIQLDFPEEVELGSAPAVAPAAGDDFAASDALGEAGVKAVSADAFLNRNVQDLVESTPHQPERVVDPLDAIPGEDAGALWSGAEAAPQVLEAVAPAKDHVASNSATAPGFLRKSKKASRRSGRIARFFVASICVLLVCSLAVQILVQERDRIAATEPATLALLEPLCAVAGCRIAPLRQIESVVIDHSAFSKIQPSVYRFSFAIKSTALVPLAVPSLELTLTDLQDRPVVRRVFLPRELGAQAEIVVPGGEWSGSVPVEIKMPGGAVSIASYRLLAFYP